MVYKKIEEYLMENEYEVSCSIPNFVSEISNIYHKFESENYHLRHKKMFEVASIYWNKIITSNLEYFKEDLSLLNYGSGTGFEIITILKSPLKNKISKIICYDLSKEMLLKCKENIEKNELNLSNIEIEYIFNEKDISTHEKYDIVITNALLHHLPNLKLFFNFLLQKLNKDGVFIMGHEPNTSFYTNEYLLEKTQQFRLYKKIITAFSFKKIALKLGLNTNQLNDDIITKTNKDLLDRSIINKELPSIIISKLVDIHVPIGFSKDQVWGEMGFDKNLIINKYMPELELIALKSYFHIKDYKSLDSIYWKTISKRLAKKYPNDGADCILMFKRK
tara:strand:- start:38 stop:1039 length:1002 start_codon:yes stop_codon:yes gene_type:complete